MIHSEKRVSILVSVATGYANSMRGIFSLFLTVIFGSLGFAAALPLKDIGSTHTILGFGLSTSSLLVGGEILAFYLITFAIYDHANRRYSEVSDVLHKTIGTWGPGTELLWYAYVGLRRACRPGDSILRARRASCPRGVHDEEAALSAVPDALP